jgi:glycosyltransferase involved in cell wall biosynthesis
MGAVSLDRLFQLYREADVFLFTSLRCSGGTVLLEAMAHSLPVLTVDHQGASVLVPAEAGVKIKPVDSEILVQGLADGMVRLARDRNLRLSMGSHGWQHARTQTWPARVKRITALYEDLAAPALSPIHGQFIR